MKKQTFIIFSAIVLFQLVYKPLFSQCTADYSYEVSGIYGCNTLFFTDISTASSGYTIFSWDWDFGDGSTSQNQHPIHSFSNSGYYSVNLSIISDSLGFNCYSSETKQIFIQEPLIVDLSWVPDPVYQGQQINFFGTSSNYADYWYWEFGDGNTSTLQNPLHIYNHPGVYSILLYAVDTNYCEDTTIRQITVMDGLSVFPLQNTIWNTIGENSLTFENWRFRYGLTGDTILSTTKDSTYIYHKLYSLYDSTLTHPNSTYFGGIRIISDSLVCLKVPDLPETILYDFSSEVGDTIWFNVRGSACKNIIHLEEASHFKVVTQIDSIQLLDNNYHVRRYLEGQNINDTWVDGIGSIDWVGLLNPLITDITLCGDNYSFACLKENEDYLYINNPDCDLCFCYLLTDITKEKDFNEILNIYPIPANDQVSIVLNELTTKDINISVYNSHGALKLNESFKEEKTIQINTSSWESGVYTFIVFSEGIVLYKNKVIVLK